MSGIGKIAVERERVLRKGRTPEDDYNNNKNNELNRLASNLISYNEEDINEDKFVYIGVAEEEFPTWPEYYLSKLYGKSYKQRLVIAGQLIAAEIDRLEYEENLREYPVIPKDAFTKPGIRGQEIKIVLSEDYNSKIQKQMENYNEETEDYGKMNSNNIFNQKRITDKENIMFIKDVLQFHKLVNHPILDAPKIPNTRRYALRVSLIQEELNELEQAIENNDIIECADAFADLMYVLCGAILEFGLGNEFYEVFQEVQRSNMSKACNTYDEALEIQKYYLESKQTESVIVSYDNNKTFIVESFTGKTLKSINYSPANIKDILNETN